MEAIRSSHGSVGLEVFQGRLRLRLPRKLFNGKQTYLSLGVDDTKLNRKIAEAKIRQIELDILSENFDSTLTKYKAQTHLAVVENLIPKQQIDLSNLWLKHRDFKQPNRSQSWLMTCNQQTKYLAKCPYKSLEKSKEIFNWIISNIPAHSAKRLVVELSACCDWGVKNNFITDNPFKGLASKIDLKKVNSEDNDINPFSKEERDAIVAAFKANSYYNHYANYVLFLFLTGARPSEVIALQWKHISNKSICFEQAVVRSPKGLMLKQGLKTQSKRVFPVNAQLLELLNSMRLGLDINPDDLVFPAPTGSWIDIHNFRNRAWKTIMSSLNIEYRKPYQTRHTFVTMALETDVSIPQIARWVGNSPQVIMESYAGTIRKVAVPEL
ncbi:site-specific integrase [Synechocystis sp. PCC 7509]|uniref:site-specific integrase n=1 Tax=Synechocystis sp. PCC 7509 TaxID=927677 RepID=UPI0002ACEF54|nr:site-specific integrase [Synechocystis sp. PCC 7509]